VGLREEIARRRTFAIISHPDAGKTTLTEKLLLFGGCIHEAGAVVLPASPGFYARAETVGDLVDFVVARICDQLDVPNTLIRRWGEAT